MGMLRLKTYGHRHKPYQQQNEGIGVCTAVYGNAVAEGIGIINSKMKA